MSNVANDTEPLPFAMVACWLEECGYRRHEIGDLTRKYVMRVLGWPKDKEGKCIPPRSNSKPLTRIEELRAIYLRRNMPLHRIDDLIKEQLDGAQQRRHGKQA